MTRRVTADPDRPRSSSATTGQTYAGTADGRPGPSERPDGGRGFGFTGAHFHKNWGNPDFRTLVLNAILWTAKLDVPSGGVKCNVSDEDLKQNLDPKPKRGR